MRLTRAVVRSGWLWLLVAPLAAVVAVVLHREGLRVPDGDESHLEVTLQEMPRVIPLVGAPSRLGFHHPGPLHFVVPAAGYHCVGGWMWGAAAGCALFTGAILGYLAHLLRKRAEGGAERLGFGLTLGAIALAIHPMFLGTGFASVWNPVLPLLPYALALVVASHVEARPQDLVLLVALHAFTAQAHLAYAPLSTLLLLHSSLLVVVRSPARNRVVPAAIAVGFVLWLPPLIDALRGRGNLQQLVRHFAAGAASQRSLGQAMSDMAWRLTTPLRVAFGDHPLEPDASGWLVWGGCAFMVALVAARATSGSPSGLLARVWLGQVVLGTVLVRGVDEPWQAYPTYWVQILGAFGLGLAVVEGARRIQGGVGAKIVRVAALAAPGLAGLALVVPIMNGVAQRELDRRDRTSAVDAFVESFDRSLGLPLEWDHELWDLGFATLAGLRRLGSVDVASDGVAAIRLTTGPHAECALLAERGATRLVACDGSDPPRIVRRRLRLAPMATPGAVGEFVVLEDGRDHTGDAWDGPHALRWSDPVTWTFAVEPGVASEIIFVADGNDTYSVMGSGMGGEQVPLGVATPIQGLGLRRRDLQFVPALVSSIAILPVDGDGAYSLSEVAVMGVPAVRIVAVSPHERDVGLLSDGVVAPRGAHWDDPRAVIFRGRGWIELEVPDGELLLGLVADHDERWELETTEGAHVATLAPDHSIAGLTSRWVRVGGATPRRLRLRVGEGDGLASVAELRLGLPR